MLMLTRFIVCIYLFTAPFGTYCFPSSFEVSLVICSAFLLVFAHLRPPEIENQTVNKTVRSCCEGWGGPRCSEGELFPRFKIPLKYSFTFLFSLLFFLLLLLHFCLPFPSCLPGVGARGQCFSTWSCQEFPGVHNSSLMPMEQCCSSLWGLSWRNASDGSCLSCTYTLLPGQTTCMHICAQSHKHQQFL